MNNMGQKAMNATVLCTLTCILVAPWTMASPNEPSTAPDSSAIAKESNRPKSTNSSKRASNGFDLVRGTLVGSVKSAAARKAYFGDLHVHTTYSLDAFAFGTTATPDDAYRYARGEAITHPAGFKMQLREPLDFYAVTDHAGFLGIAKEAADTSSQFSEYPYLSYLHNLNNPENLGFDSLPTRIQMFGSFVGATILGVRNGSVSGDLITEIMLDAWSDTIRAAEHHNRPGEFTTFVGYEYTASTDEAGNLHRNVIFRGAKKLPRLPFSILNSRNPEELWTWMDGLREQGIESLAIPHNSNGSNGAMFPLRNWNGEPIDAAYARKRMRNEPLVEITQVKGTSDTHPALSDNDEWANFEIMPYRVATRLPSAINGSYVREALINGISLEQQGLQNPYKFGLVGSSDTHTGAISDDESNYFAKVGLLDATPQQRGSVPVSSAEEALFAVGTRASVKEIEGRNYISGASETYGASGLTGVWAEDNTRDSIYDALKRKETFATTGPRIKVRFLAGYDFDKRATSDLAALESAYAKGVSMGSDLVAQEDNAPTFIAWALKDPHSAPLQRIQIIKGWIDEDGKHERVFDVACSENAVVDPSTYRCPDNDAKVNLADCSYTNDVGAAALKASWKDPTYVAGERAFYYLRALENPTCRWSTWDALRANVRPRPDLPVTIQERAWSSPIWHLPLT